MYCTDVLMSHCTKTKERFFCSRLLAVAEDIDILGVMLAYQLRSQLLITVHAILPNPCAIVM